MKELDRVNTWRRLTGLALAVGGLAFTAGADERFFGYVYDADVLPAGRWEAEQHITFGKGYPGGDRRFSVETWNFREELEYGVTDRFSVAGYLNFRNEDLLARSPEVRNASDLSFQGGSVELKYQILNPNLHPVGLAVYLEPSVGSHEVELEEKIILSRSVGDHWVFAGNVSLEQEWEREDGETLRESVLEVAAGASYRLTPHWAVGLEARYHSVYEGLGWRQHLGTAWFLGPNLHYGGSRFWGTLTVLPQIAGNPGEGRLNLSEHSKFEVRLLLGWNF